VKHRRVAAGCLILAGMTLTVCWIVGRGRCDVFFLRNGVPMAGCVAQVLVVEGDASLSHAYALDATGRLHMGWRLFNRPASLIVLLPESNGHTRTHSLSGDLLNGAVIDLRGSTIVTIRIVKLGSVAYREGQAVTELRPSRP